MMAIKIIIFGAGTAGYSDLEYFLQNSNYEVICFADNSVDLQGSKVKGYEVIAPNEIPAYSFDYVAIASMYYNDIFEQLVNVLGISAKKITYSRSTYINMSNDLRILNKFEEARDITKQGLNTYFKDSSLLVEHIRSYIDLKQYSLASKNALDIVKQYNNNFDISKWEAVISDFFNTNIKLEEKAIIEKTDQLLEDQVTIPLGWWMNLYYYFFMHGYFQAAYHFKEIALQIAKNTNKYFEVDNLPIIQAFLETKDYQTAYRLIEQEIDSSTNLKTMFFYNLLASVYYMTGNINDAFNIWDDEYIKTNDKNCYSSFFDDLVRGKTVAIVGGADVDLYSGEEIDSYEVVIRTSYVGKKMRKDIKRKIGERTTVSYYCQTFLKVIPNNFFKSIDLLDCKAIVLRDDDVACRKLRKCGLNVHVRTARAYKGLFKSLPFATQRIILDVIRYQPKSIKVFNSDFFLGLKHHHKDYYSKHFNPVQRGGGQLYSIMLHDPLRDFIHAKALFKIADIATDSRLQEVMALDNETFLKLLNKRFSPDNF